VEDSCFLRKHVRRRQRLGHRPRCRLSSRLSPPDGAHILVQIDYARVPRFRHDSATPVPLLPTVALAADLKGIEREGLGFAQTQLVRGQNRLIAALREAERLAAPR
jgi:hypothetical protein